MERRFEEALVKFVTNSLLFSNISNLHHSRSDSNDTEENSETNSPEISLQNSLEPAAAGQNPLYTILNPNEVSGVSRAY